MADRLRVLFLCTGNSARSQMAEGLLRSLSKNRIDVYSAGTFPKSEIHPMAVAAMRDKFQLDISAQSPKNLDRYVGEDFDYVITVCDRAAEACPVFPGAPQRIHWGFTDPAAAEGSEAERQRAFNTSATEIAARLRLWLALPAVSARI